MRLLQVRRDNVHVWLVPAISGETRQSCLGEKPDSEAPEVTGTGQLTVHPEKAYSPVNRL